MRLSLSELRNWDWSTFFLRNWHKSRKLRLDLNFKLSKCLLGCFSVKCQWYVTEKTKPWMQYRIPEKVKGDSQGSDERNMKFSYFQTFSKRITNTTGESSKSLCPLWHECMILRSRIPFSALVKWADTPSALIASSESWPKLVNSTSVIRMTIPKWYSRQGSWHKTFCVCYSRTIRALALSSSLYLKIQNFFLS